MKDEMILYSYSTLNTEESPTYSKQEYKDSTLYYVEDRYQILIQEITTNLFISQATDSICANISMIHNRNLNDFQGVCIFSRISLEL